MKFQMLLTVLLTILILTNLNGCALMGMEEKLDAAEDMVEDRVDAMEDAIQTAVLPEPPRDSSGNAPAEGLTREQAEAIALEHAGFTADQVNYLRSVYEIDDGIPQYEVSFHQGRWEYVYEINAETGNILSFEKDD